METNMYPPVKSMHTDWLSDDLKKKCPFLMKYTNSVKHSPRKIIGREHEMLRLAAILSAPELCNACLIGEAGSFLAAGAEDTGRTIFLM